MPFFQTSDGCRIYHECHGITTQRQVVVFLNGTTQTTVNWLPHARALEEHFGVILYDARGQGKSDLGNKPLSLEQHTADLALLFNLLRLKTAHLVGLSHGDGLKFRRHVCGGRGEPYGHGYFGDHR